MHLAQLNNGACRCESHEWFLTLDFSLKKASLQGYGIKMKITEIPPTNNLHRREKHWDISAKDITDFTRIASSQIAQKKKKMQQSR